MKKIFTFIALSSTALAVAQGYESYPYGGGNGYQEYQPYYQGYQEPNYGYQSYQPGYYGGPQGYYGNTQWQGGNYSTPQGQGNYSRQGQGYYGNTQWQGGNYSTPQGQGNYNGQMQRNNNNAQEQGNYNNPRQQGNSGYDQNGNPKSSSDQEIGKKVGEALNPGWFVQGYPRVSYQVNNGVVTLTGSVDTQDDKSKLEQSIKSINGVRQVNDQVVVKKANGQENSQSFGQNNQRTDNS